MRRIPFMILLCLLVSYVHNTSSFARSKSIDVIIKPTDSITVNIALG